MRWLPPAVETGVARRVPCDSVTPQNDIVATGFCFIRLFLIDKKNENFCFATTNQLRCTGDIIITRINIIQPALIHVEGNVEICLI
jgi:hypothetical protein